MPWGSMSQQTVPKLGAAARTSGNQTFPAYFSLSIVCGTWHIFLAQISRISLSLSTKINAPDSRVDYHTVVWDSELRSGNPRSRWEELTGAELASSRKHCGSPFLCHWQGQQWLLPSCIKSHTEITRQSADSVMLMDWTVKIRDPAKH